LIVPVQSCTGRAWNITGTWGQAHTSMTTKKENIGSSMVELERRIAEL